MSKKTLVLKINLRTWFPPNDPFASHVARLCILREDFALEMAGIATEQIDTFDGNHPFGENCIFGETWYERSTKFETPYEESKL